METIIITREADIKKWIREVFRRASPPKGFAYRLIRPDGL
jgi:hypothetical protein